MIDYAEIIDCRGIRIPFVPAIITPKIERPLRNGRYELGERKGLQALLRPGDRVLELGAGLGLLSAVAALAPGIGAVTTVEANPGLIPLIRETHRLNGADHVDLRHGVVTAEPGPPVAFHIRPDFWGSSMDPSAGRTRTVAEVPRLTIDSLIAEVRPTVIVCDIEGGEVGLLEHADLSGVRAVVMEFHERLYGPAPRAAIAALLAAAGLHPSGGVAGSSVGYFLRQQAPEPVKSLLAARPPRPWPLSDPRVVIVTCMKDEGPFILEWLAWHRAVGVTDFVVFTNDCSDGTDLMLDRLQDLGLVLHLPNPAISAGHSAFQPAALNFAHGLKQVREADYFISMDVDEFLNIRAGTGHLDDLFSATGPFDVLSIAEVNHGANTTEKFIPGWVTEQYPLHQSTTPGMRKARRGVKSIVRLSDRVERLRNHRPDMFPDRGPVVWLDGSGRPQISLASDRRENGLDCRGTYDLVRLEHYALRSLECYLAKMGRGDVVVANKRVSRAYWRTRNHNEEDTADLGARRDRARDWHATHLEIDAHLMKLHHACCQAHADRIARLLTEPDFRDRRDWIISESW